MQNKNYQLINSNDEFLLEYNDIKTSKRFALTGFSGSVGDALIDVERNIIYLFVDGRYYEQARKQAKKNVEVVNLMMGENQDEKIIEIIPKNSVLEVNPKTLNLNRFKFLDKMLKEKEVKIVKNSEKEIFHEFEQKLVEVPLSICGKSTKEKIKMFKGKTFLITKLEDIAYLTNRRSFDLAYSSSFKAKLIVKNDKVNLFFNLDDFEKYVKKLNEKINYFETDISLYDYELIKKNACLKKNNPIEKARSMKNRSEIKHLKEC